MINNFHNHQDFLEFEMIFHDGEDLVLLTRSAEPKIHTMYPLLPGQYLISGHNANFHVKLCSIGFKMMRRNDIYDLIVRLDHKKEKELVKAYSKAGNTVSCL